MANRIKGVDAGAIAPGNGGPVEQVRRSNPLGSALSDAPAVVSTDSVHITASARTLAALSQAIQDTPNVDNVRVANLQQSIDNGQYAIDSQRIAEHLLQLEQDLSAAQ